MYVRAAYYVAFGPHGPRAPTNPPGTVPKVIGGVAAAIGAATAIYLIIRANGACSVFLVTQRGLC